jgi:hypothetical protein
MNVIPISQLEGFTTRLAKQLLNARVELMKLGIPSEIKEVSVSVMVVDDGGLNAVERSQLSAQPETTQVTENGPQKQVQTTVKDAATSSQTQITDPVEDRQGQSYGRSTSTDVSYTS